MSGPEAHEPQRLDNGLLAAQYVPLTDVDPDVGAQLLTALGRARIAAYLAQRPDDPEASGRTRLFVASDERVDARTIVAAAVRALERDAEAADASTGADLLDDPERTDAAFRALVADWHVDTVAAVRDAERELSREDVDWRLRLNKPAADDPVWLDDDHYVPPPPPPLPRLAGPTIIAMAVLTVSIIVLGLGGQIGLANGLSLALGLAGLLLAACLLFSRVREFRRDDTDDGSAL
ncbi:hypothetical protein [uncultured Jatrophihabitans sp.]|uniref:hypothetical protein n=1 Tax=uncultured Jatrophihabitans sp. TaxID=1610747 RepID=UPI0035CBAA1F